MKPEQLLEHFNRMGDAPDAVPRLRRFILDLAVRGKFVPQDASDEPATELFKRIATERARLVKTGEIRRPKPFSAVEDIPFDIPSAWRWTRIREVASDRGQMVPDDAFTYIDVTAIDKENGVVAAPKVLSASEAPSRARKITRKGDVIYSCVRPYLLNVAVIDENFDPAPIASTAFAVLNGHGLVVPRYLWIVLRSPFMVECVERTQRGQAYPAINDADFAVLPFPLPPLAEQHRIVAKVDELMALCDRLEAARAQREAARDRLAAASLARLNAPDPDPAAFAADARFALANVRALTMRPDEVKQLRQTILNLAVQGRLEPQDARDEPASELLAQIGKEIAAFSKRNRIGQVRPEPIESKDMFFAPPPGWQWTRLSALFNVITDGDHQPPPKAEVGVAFLTIGNITTGRLEFSGCRLVPESYFQSLAPYRTPSKGDILYTVVGATYGRPAIVDADRAFCVQRHIAILKPVRSMDLRYIYWLLASPLIYDQATRSTTGTAQPTIALRPLRNFVVPLPPLAEQHRIVAKVDDLMALCDRLETSIAARDDTRRRLLDTVLQAALAPAPDEAA